jgi:hypothetical protein
VDRYIHGAIRTIGVLLGAALVLGSILNTEVVGVLIGLALLTAALLL